MWQLAWKLTTTDNKHSRERSLNDYVTSSTNTIWQKKNFRSAVSIHVELFTRSTSIQTKSVIKVFETVTRFTENHLRMPRSFLIKKKPEKSPKNTLDEAKSKGGIALLFALVRNLKALSLGNKCMHDFMTPAFSQSIPVKLRAILLSESQINLK